MRSCREVRAASLAPFAVVLVVGGVCVLSEGPRHAASGSSPPPRSGCREAPCPQPDQHPLGYDLQQELLPLLQEGESGEGGRERGSRGCRGNGSAGPVLPPEAAVSVSAGVRSVGASLVLSPPTHILSHTLARFPCCFQFLLARELYFFSPLEALCNLFRYLEEWGIWI